MRDQDRQNDFKHQEHPESHERLELVEMPEPILLSQVGPMAMKYLQIELNRARRYIVPERRYLLNPWPCDF